MTKVADISGRDHERKQYGYEWGCQVVAARALRWMRQHAVCAGSCASVCENIAGFSPAVNQAAEQMEKYILKHDKLREFGVTGALMESSISHAKFRFLNGEEKYLAEFKDKPKRIFEFDERDAFPEDAS